MAVAFEFWKFEILVFVISVCAFFYMFAKRQYSYWERNGFKSLPNPSWILGHFKSTFTQQEHIANFIQKIYKTTTEPFIGIYSILRPILIVHDPEVVRTILIKDFRYFTDRKQNIFNNFSIRLEPNISKLYISFHFIRWSSL